MMVKVNLIPESYRQRCRRRGWLRLGVGVGLTLLVGELGAGLALHARTATTREQLAETQDTRQAIQALREGMAGPAREASLLDQQVTLATRLRTTHRWSRLLGMLAQATPEKVVLTTVATNPSKWMAARNKAPAKQPPGKPDTPMDVKPWLEGIVINGYAADHDDLSAFMARIQTSGAFASIDLKNARRDQFLSQDAIMFELRCSW